MEIIDIQDSHHSLYCKCLQDWSAEMEEAGSRKSEWFKKYKDLGLRVKMALDDNNEIGGMIHYIPIEHSFINGENLYFIYCIWVHGYKDGRGDFRKQGMGKALIAAAEEDVKGLGSNGIVAWGVSLPFWMKASWFKKYGYKKIDKDGIAQLLWKPFNNQAKKPCWVRIKKKPSIQRGEVTVTSFIHGWCPAQNITYERAKKAVEEIGSPVNFIEIDTTIEANFDEWGITDALFIDGKKINTGPPPSYDKILKMIKRQVRKRRL